MSAADDEPYTIKQQEQLFAVQDDSGRTIVTSGDKSNAASYAVLLNEAYRKGYKDGYRKGRAGSAG